MLDPDLQEQTESLCVALDTATRLLRDNNLTHTQLYQVIDSVGDVYGVLQAVSEIQCTRDIIAIGEDTTQK